MCMSSVRFDRRSYGVTFVFVVVVVGVGVGVVDVGTRVRVAVAVAVDAVDAVGVRVACVG